MAASKVSNWVDIEGLAERHLVAPIVHEVVATTGVPIPPTQKRALGALAVRHRHAYSVRSACLSEILDAFSAGGIRPLILKGMALSELVYPDPALRPMRDIDLLVDKQHLLTARNTISDLGYEFVPHHRSRYMGRHHHLPEATRRVDGLDVTIEIHHDALSADCYDSITCGNLTEPPRQVVCREGQTAAVLGHVDMLRHLCRHTFEPAAEVRLIHAMDIVYYLTEFAESIDWPLIAARYPAVTGTIACLHYLLSFPERVATYVPRPARRELPGVGYGMKPLSHIAAAVRRPTSVIRDLMNPPAWWLHGHYGIHPDRSLAWTRTVTHPVTVSRWVSRRGLAALTGYHNDL